MIIFIDESGDLGFDLFKSGTSPHFVITAMVLRGNEDRKILEKGVERTLKNKINVGKAVKNPTSELKGTKTSLEVKAYFWRQIKDIEFGLFSVIVEKREVPPTLVQDKARLYNYLARNLVDEIPINQANPSLLVEIDKSKSGTDREEFNIYLENHIKGKLLPKVALTIRHSKSEESRGIQAVDMFCWGIARKCNMNDISWYDVFCGKIKIERNEPITL